MRFLPSSCTSSNSSALAAATYNQATILYQHFSGRCGALDRLRCPDLEVFSPKTGVRARPGLKAAQAVKISWAVR